MRIGMAQLNPTVGDLDGNVEKIIEAIDDLRDSSDLIVFSELAVTGYPPEDLLLKPQFLTDQMAALMRVIGATKDTAAVVGFVDQQGGLLYNAAALCVDGYLRHVYRKRLLPNYSVFDEARYFTASKDPATWVDINGTKVSIAICEDIWQEEGPVAEYKHIGAEVVVVLNASPYYYGRPLERERHVSGLAKRHGLPVVYVNQVGGQDELVFDGSSFAVTGDGGLVTRLDSFSEGLAVADLDRPCETIMARFDRLPEVYNALVLGTRDYVTKNGFTDVVVGLSGGIDSALVAAIAADALGPENVHGVLMPSRYSSEHSITDAIELADQLGISWKNIPIREIHDGFDMTFSFLFAQWAEDTTEENAQSRIRGMILMALSNKFGWMVLSTGNKSETAVGYSTLYGDTVGGYAVIKDVPKLLVYELSAMRGLPESIIRKAPSAELRPDQTDDQSLPPYEVLDPILEAYIEQDMTASELREAGYDNDDGVVDFVVNLVDRAEYKRRQSPPGPRVTTKAFGKDRRLPITNGYGLA